MTKTVELPQSLSHRDRFLIGGEWVKPSSAATIDVIDSATEDLFVTVAEAKEADVQRAVAAARRAFDEGPWPKLSHAERAEYLRAFADALRSRAADFGQIWPRESGVIHAVSDAFAADFAGVFDYYADLSGSFAFEEPMPTSIGGFGLLVREPVGVVAAIVPWNCALGLLSWKIAPALLAGCTLVLKSAPEAPGEGYLLAEVAQEIGLPPGVLNTITANREVSESLVRDPRVDKITFTGASATGRRIASLCGERIARCTLELGGKSAAIILDDADLESAATTLATNEIFLTGQVCASLTRIVVPRDRHDELVEALVENFARVRIGDPYDPETHMGPLVSRRQRDRVEGYIAKGVEQGARLATGGDRPKHLDRGWFIEPTVFADVDNSSVIAQEEIFGPVLTVIPADDEDHAVTLANDSIYGLNATVFTPDVDRALRVAGRLRSGTVGQNGFRADCGIAFGGYKQSGLGREGGREGLLPYLELKTVLLDEPPADYTVAAAE